MGPWLTQLFLRSDAEALALQLSLTIAYTLILVYVTAFWTRRSTYIKSHLWLWLQTIVASVLVLACLRVLVTYRLTGWRGLLVIVLWSLPVEIVVRVMGRGKSLVDVRGDRLVVMQTDERLIRRAAMFALIIGYSAVQSLLK